MKFKTKIIQKSKLKTVILVLLITLSIASFINTNSNFSIATQKIETPNTSAPITPKYKYVYENDFDYYSHYTQLDTTDPTFPSEIVDDLIGEDTEWSQDPADSNILHLNYVGGLDPWVGLFSMYGLMLVESHNTFEKHSNSKLGVYVDWSIDLDITPEGIDLLSIRAIISLSILKPTNPTKFEELVTIENLNLQEGTFYLANFSQYIWNDGKIRFAISGLIYGYTSSIAPYSLIFASLKFKGLRVVQEIKPVQPEQEQRTLILVHGFAFEKTYPIFWWTYLNSSEFHQKNYDKIIVISYLVDYRVYKYSKDEYGVWHDDDVYDLDVADTSIWTSIRDIATGLALYIMQDYDYVGDNVDIICHSMGGLVTRFMIKHYYSVIQDHYAILGRNFKIHNVCTIATPNHGLWYGSIIFNVVCTQTGEMVPSSLFLTELNTIGVYLGTEIPLSGIDINWFTYRSGIYESISIFIRVRHDGVVDVSSALLSGATDKGLYPLDHGGLVSNKMMNYVVFNDIVKPPEIVQTIFNEGTPGKIMGIEDLTLEERTLSISLPLEIATDIDPNSVYIEINPVYQMFLVEGTTDTYEVELPLAAGDYSFLITANILDGGLYQISGNLKILPDVASPMITFITPTDGLITNEDVILTYTISDDYSDISDITIIGAVSGTIYNSEGSYEIEITAIDEASNEVTETISFIIDKTAPVIDITSPFDGLITNQDVELIYTVSDDTSALANIDITGPQSGTTYSSEGFHEVTITATDEAGNTASKSLTMLIDKTVPVIDITSPIDGLITNQDVDLIYIVSDDTSAPADIDVSGPASGTTYSSEGSPAITITATDEAGNTVSETVSFIIDRTVPEIVINDPSQDDKFGKEAPNYEISITEPNLESIWYTIDGGLTNYTINQVSGTIDQMAWDAAPYDNVTIRFYAKDLAGNIDYREVTVEKVTVEEVEDKEPAIPFELITIASVIGGGAVIVIAIVLLYRRRRKTS